MLGTTFIKSGGRPNGRCIRLNKQMKCTYCELLEENKRILYSDDLIAIAVKGSGLVPGQIVVFPKQHFTILEMVPDEILTKCSLIANKVGMAVFDSLGAQGTNVLVKNGLGAGQEVPHFALEVIPRQANDNLALQWEPLEVNEYELESTLSQLQESGKEEKKEKTEKATATAQPEVKVDAAVPHKEKGKENYLLKSLRRMP